MDSLSAVNANNNLKNLSPTNYLDKFKNPPAKLPEESQDKIVINRDFIADLKYNEEKAAIGTIIEGSVNNKPAVFKVVSNSDDETWYEGALDKKYLLLHCNGNEYNGKYGNSEFKLRTDYNKPSKFSEFFNQNLLGNIFMPDYFTVTGTIGNKEVNITLPDAKIPSDRETRDLLTLLLEENGLKAQTIDGEVKSLKFASSAVKNIKRKAEKRKKVIDENVKPIIMNGISSVCGTIIGALSTLLLLKLGLKR